MKFNTNAQKILSGAMAGFIIAVLIAIISSANTIRYIYVMQKDLRTWYEKDLIGQSSIQIARVNLLNLDRDLKILLLTNEAGLVKTVKNNISRHRDNFAMQMATARHLFTSSRNSEQIEHAVQLSREYLKELNDVINRNNTERFTAVSKSYKSLAEKFEEIDRILDRLDDIKQENDLEVFSSIISQNELSLAISFTVLFFTIIFRILQLSAIRKKNKNGECS